MTEDPHDGYSFDLTTPRAYTPRGGWLVSCACGTGIGESQDEDLLERHMRHVERERIREKVKALPTTRTKAWDKGWDSVSLQDVLDILEGS